jgi:dihydroxyacid dehydratase/phosphogluconate dehydratase
MVDFLVVHMVLLLVTLPLSIRWMGIALVNNGDIITIDAINNTINLKFQMKSLHLGKQNGYNLKQILKGVLLKYIRSVL